MSENQLESAPNGQDRWQITRIDGRYPAAIRIKATGITASLTENGDEILLRLDDPNHIDFWIEVSIRKPLQNILQRDTSPSP